MTVHDLHDALNLLPSDLITAADRIRTVQKVRVIPWRKWMAMAAILALTIGTTMIFSREMYPYMSDAKLESTAQAPAAAAPMTPLPAEKEIAADEAAPEEPAADAPATGSVTGSENGMKEELYIDHSHRFAEETEMTDSTGAYCGNTVTTVYLGGEEYSFGGTDSITITKILKNLPYDPAETCRCMAEFTVDTEWLEDIEVNLSQGFARCELGQAALTEAQVTTLREIIEKLK